MKCNSHLHETSKIHENMQFHASYMNGKFMKNVQSMNNNVNSYIQILYGCLCGICILILWTKMLIVKGKMQKN